VRVVSKMVEILNGANGALTTSKGTVVSIGLLLVEAGSAGASLAYFLASLVPRYLHVKFDLLTDLPA
jgi:hypothetical protein